MAGIVVSLLIVGRVNNIHVLEDHYHSSLDMIDIKNMIKNKFSLPNLIFLPIEQAQTKVRIRYHNVLIL